MWVNQIFSVIMPVTSNEITIDTIQNIIVCDGYDMANQVARLTYGDDAYAIETTLYPLTKGCTYVDGKFYNLNGDEVSRNLTAEEKASEVLIKANLLEERQVNTELEVDYRLSRIELGLA